MTKPIHVVREKGGLGDMIRICGALDGLEEKYPARPIYYYGPEKYRDLMMPYCRGMRRTGCRYIATDEMASGMPPGGDDRKRGIAMMTGCDDAIDLNCPALRHERETAGRPTRERTVLFCETAGVPVRRPQIGDPCPRCDSVADRWWRENSIMLHFRSAGTLRSWPATKAECLLDRLQGTFSHIGLLDKCMNWPWYSLVEYVALAGIVVAVDSGIFHLAGALSKPVIGLFGSTDGKLVSSIYPTASYIQAPNVHGCLRPCYCYNENGFGDPECGLQGCANLNALSAETVFRHVMERLQNEIWPAE